MISPMETQKEIVDAFIAFLCAPDNEQEKAKQKKTLLSALNVKITEFSPDVANYFIWQLCLKSNGLGIVGCGSTEFSRLITRFPTKSQTVLAFERLLNAKESEIKRHRSAFEESFLKWFDKLNTSSDPTIAENHLKEVLLTIAHIDRVQVDDDVLPLDVYLISRLKPWINRLFLLLEEKYAFSWNWAPFIALGSRWVSELSSNPEEEHKVNVIQSRIFSLFTDQSMLFCHAREGVKNAIMSCLSAPQSSRAEESLQDALLVLRRSIDMFGNEGVGDMGKLMEILLKPVANEIAKIVSETKQTNHAILAIENMIKHWNDALDTITCTDTQIRLLDASTSLESLHRLLAKILPLDENIQYLHEKLDMQATIISDELARATEESSESKGICFNNIDMYLRQIVSRIPLVDHTFFAARHIFDEQNGFELLKKEYEYFNTLKGHLKQLGILDKKQNHLKNQIYRAIHELLKVLDEIALHLFSFVENEILPEAKRHCIQIIHDFKMQNSIFPIDDDMKGDPKYLLSNALKALELNIIESCSVTDICGVRKNITQFWENVNKENEDLLGYLIPYSVMLEPSIVVGLNKLLEDILSVMPNPYVPAYVKTIIKIEQAMLHYQGEMKTAEKPYLSDSERSAEEAVKKSCEAEELGIFTSSRPGLR